MSFLGALQAVVGLLVLAALVVLFARSALRPGNQPTSTAGDVFNVVEEVFSPARHQTRLELRAREEMGPVTPTPDDWLPKNRTDSVRIRRTRA